MNDLITEKEWDKKKIKEENETVSHMLKIYHVLVLFFIFEKVFAIHFTLWYGMHLLHNRFCLLLVLLTALKTPISRQTVDRAKSHCSMFTLCARSTITVCMRRHTNLSPMTMSMFSVQMHWYDGHTINTKIEELWVFTCGFSCLFISLAIATRPNNEIMEKVCTFFYYCIPSMRNVRVQHLWNSLALIQIIINKCRFLFVSCSAFLAHQKHFGVWMKMQT